MPTFTPKFNLMKPLVNNAIDQDLWGGEINDDLDIVDAELFTAQNWVTRVVTTADSPTEADRKKLLLCNATGGAFSVTLPSVADGFTIAVKKTDASANAVTIVGTIDGSTNKLLTNQNDSVQLVSDGTNWFTITGTIPIASTTVKGVIEIATDAEAIAGVETDKAIVPSNIKRGANFTKGLDGITEQWGIVSNNTSGMVSVVFPIPFTRLDTLINNAIAPTNSPNEYYVAEVFGASLTGFQSDVKLNGDSNPVGQRATAQSYWRAWGVTA